MTPTSTQPKPLADRRADAIFKLVAATGFLLNTFNHLEFLSGSDKPVFTHKLKYTATHFKAELERAEAIITKLDPDNPHMMQQMADSYDVLDTLLGIMLQAGRILTPEAIELMNADMLVTAKKWGVILK